MPALFLLALVFLAGCSARTPSVATAPKPVVDQKMDVIEAARSNIGVPYRFGGTSPQTGFDCSGLVCWSYEQVGITLPRRAKDQIRFGQKVESKADLQPGDIVVFKGTRSRTGWHSGIYTGDGRFVHSPSTGKTVTESSLNEGYFAKRYVGARRIPRDGSAKDMLVAFKAERQTEKGSRNATVAASKKSPKAATVASAGAASGKSAGAEGKTSGKAPARAPGKAANKTADKAVATAEGKTADKAVAGTGNKTPDKAAVTVSNARPTAAKSPSPDAKSQASGSKKQDSGKKADTPLQTAAADSGDKTRRQAAGVVDKLKAESQNPSPSARNVAKAKDR